MASLFDLQQKNRRKTKIIVVCFILFFLWLGLGLDLAIYYLKGSRLNKHYQRTQTYQTSDAATQTRRPFYPVFSGAIGLMGVCIAWWSMSNASETILRAMLATPAQREHSPGEQMLINVVEEMSIASGMPSPKVWVIPDSDPNALATGMKEGDYHIAVTRGLLTALNRDELQAVVAHEMAHLKNDDTRLMTSLTVLVGMAALISEFVARVRFVRLGGGSGNSSRNSDDSRLGIVILVLWFLTVLLAPLVTRLMTLMVSREREYLADASAAQFTRNPEALASALEKIGYAVEPTRLVKPASAHLCIASPAAADLANEESWFATHPPIWKRIARLRKMGGGQEFKDTVPMRF